VVRIVVGLLLVNDPKQTPSVKVLLDRYHVLIYPFGIPY
jgi:hypothetical protein